MKTALKILLAGGVIAALPSLAFAQANSGPGTGGGGGGGSVTLASGAVASGAYSSGSIASGAFSAGSIASGAFATGAIGSGAVASGAFAAGSLAAGAGVDGWDLTEGTKADAAYAGSGPASTIAGLKGIYANVSTGNTSLSTIAGAVTSSIVQENVKQVGGAALTAAVSAYGTAPTGTAVEGVNAYVTNTNNNGAAAASASSPVTPSNQPIGSAAFGATQVSCASTATQIVAARTGVSGTGRISETVTNTTTTAIYVGGSGVTTSTGQLLPGIVGASVTVNTTAAVYCIVATGTDTVTSLETY